MALIVLTAACAPKPPGVAAPAPAGNWISLFNGRDLSDWTAKIAGQPLGVNYRDTFSVRDGLLTVSYGGYEKFGDRFGSLFYRKPFSRYYLRAEYRFVGSLASGAPRWAYKNSGIQLHGQAPETMRLDQQFPVSVEFDLVGGWMFGSSPTGNVCQNGTRVLIAGNPLRGQCSTVGDTTIRDDRWTMVLAEVDGAQRVRHFVNGGLVVEYTDLRLDEANADSRRLIALQAGDRLPSGYISIQSNGHPIEFRRIDILPME